MSILSASRLWLPGLVVVALVGCGREASGPTMEELVRREQLRESSLLSQPKTATERLAAAQQHFTDGNVLAAQQELRPLLISRPDDPEVLLLSAKCTAAGGEIMTAAEMLEAIPEADAPAHVEASLLAAQWLVEAEQFGQALQRLERVIELHGARDDLDIHRVHRQLAMLLNNQGRRMEAGVHLRWLARSGEITERELFAMNTYSDPFIDTTVPKPDFSYRLVPAALAEAKRLRADGEIDKALILSERLSEAFGDSIPISAFQGRVYSELQREDELRQWLASTPDGIEQEPEYWHALGLWLQRQGRHREAVRCFGEAVSRDETDRFAYLAFARSLMQLGRDDEAKRAQQRFDWLTEAANIARKLGRERGTRQELNRMAEILDLLDRPWEALGWRKIALMTHGGAAQGLESLQEQRNRLAAEEASQDRLREITCGINLAEWPLPSQPETPIRTATESSRPRDEASPRQDITLVDVADQVGLHFQYKNGSDPASDQQYLHQLTGGGIGVVDYDLDGRADLYLTQGGGEAFDPLGSHPNELHRNLDGQRWMEVTGPTQSGDQGYGQGAAVADINQDGFPDIVVANIGPNTLYWNNGDGTFRRQSLASASASGDWTTSIACGDLSGDHLPEIVEINYIDDPSALQIACTPQRDECNPSVFRPARDHVWQLRSDGVLATWDGCLGIADKPNYGFAAIIANIDGRYGNDLFIANDTEQNHYWVGRQPDGARENTLVESAAVYGCAFGLLGQRQGCMGIAHGDFDHNGRLDLHVTNFWNQAADLYLQNSTGLFDNANAARGLYESTRLTVGWGTQAVDFDRDGWLDLAVLNGNLTDHRHRGRAYKMRPQLFRGAAQGFQPIRADTLTDAYWSTETLGRTMAVLDWNGDLKPDLVTNHLDVPVALLENRTSAAQGLQLELVGTLSERDAIGAEVTIRFLDQVWKGWVTGGDGLLCTNEQVLDFGLGPADSIDLVEVRWPSGLTQQFTDLMVNHRYLIVEDDGQPFQRPSSNPKSDVASR